MSLRQSDEKLADPELLSDCKFEDDVYGCSDVEIKGEFRVNVVTTPVIIRNIKRWC